MTDVPYASFNTVPDNVTRPQIDAGIGRIFSDQPEKLAQMIDGYETPVDLDPATRSAWVFSLHDESMNKKPPDIPWPAQVENELLP